MNGPRLRWRPRPLSEAGQEHPLRLILSAKKPRTQRTGATVINLTDCVERSGADAGSEDKGTAVDKIFGNMSESLSQLKTAKRSSSRHLRVTPRGEFFKN